ncbi:MAG: hypothetical protein O8C63_07970 [Candidatus Methanoperedens sp.]|nr:hypothetical protein [Candidatus Methanoperedens sp.]
MTNQASCEWKTAAQFAGSLRGAPSSVRGCGLGLRGWVGVAHVLGHGIIIVKKN